MADLTYLTRARRAAETTAIREAERDGFTIWVFCVWCAHATLANARWLVAQVKDPPNLLDELERRLKCDACGRHGV